MNREVEKVRKAITQRKKTRGAIQKKSNDSKLFIPTDEERHGYYPSIIEQTEFNKQSSQLITSFIVKGTFALLLFFGVGILWQMDGQMFVKPKQWATQALTEEFPFANTYQWYEETFGSPLALSPTTPAADQPLAFPVSGSVTESFQANGTGIMIAPNESTPVKALREGIVIFSGNDRKTNKTVTIQHADGTNSSYGYLSSIDVHLYQIIRANEQIGTFSPTEESETVFFSIKKDDEFIDPVQVIEVDDNP